MSLRPYGKDGWRVVIYAGKKPDGSPRQLTRTVGTGISEREAKRRAPAIEAALRAEAEVEQQKSGTVAELAAEFLAHKQSQGRSPVTLDGYRRICGIIVDQFGKVPLDQLNGLDIDRWYRRLNSEGASDSTITHYHSVFHAMCNQAVKWGLIEFPPTKRSTPPARPETDVKPPTPEAFVAAIAQMPESDLRRAIELVALTGLRRGELAGLWWSDVDETGVLHVQRALKEVKGEPYVQYGPLKTKRAKRKIPLGPAARAVLVEQHAWIASQVPSGAVESHSPVFPHLANDINGTVAYKPSWYTATWNKVRKQIGLPDTHLHDLRHLYVTTMLQSGASTRTVADLVGHSKPSITTDVYGHGTAEATNEAVAAIDRMIGDRLRPPILELEQEAS